MRHSNKTLAILTATLIFFMSLAVYCLSGPLGNKFFNWLSRDPYKAVKEEYYIKGKWEGALIIINQDRKAEALEPFKNWKAFEAYLDDIESNKAEQQKWFDELQAKIEKREEAKKNTIRPWVK